MKKHAMKKKRHDEMLYRINEGKGQSEKREKRKTKIEQLEYDKHIEWLANLHRQLRYYEDKLPAYKRRGICYAPGAILKMINATHISHYNNGNI